MVKSHKTPEGDVPTEELQPILIEILQNRLRDEKEIKELKRRPSAYMTSFCMEEIEVLFTDGEVWIGPEASVEGGIHSCRVVVEGLCRGRIEGLESVTLRPGSVVHGDIETNLLRVDHGARFTGERLQRHSVNGPRIAGYQDPSPGNA